MRKTGFMLAIFFCFLLRVSGWVSAAEVPPHFFLPAPWEIPPEKRIIVSPENAKDLPRIVGEAPEGATIFLRDGLYRLEGTIWVKTPGLSIRSLSGKRERVILTGEYRVGELINVQAPEVTVADLTLKEAYYHAIHLGGGGHHVKLLNLHILDCGEQLVKVNPNRAGESNDYGILAYSLLEFTEQGRHRIRDSLGNGSCYTNGIDILKARGWRIVANTFRNIYCPPGRSLPQAVLVWRGSRDTVVERNRIHNCPIGIQLGLGSQDRRRYEDLPYTASHIGGVVRNNFVSAEGEIPFDTGIGLWAARGTFVLGNTVYVPGSAFASVDLRFEETEAVVWNNLLFQAPRFRSGARADLRANVIVGEAAWFRDADAGDLHLHRRLPEVVDKGVPHELLRRDIDGEPRSNPPDAGADEFYGLAIRITGPGEGGKFTPEERVGISVSFGPSTEPYREVFLMAETPFGRFCYLYPGQWFPCGEPEVSYQGVVPPGDYPVFEGTLPPGLYRLVLFADRRPDSRPEGLGVESSFKVEPGADL